MKSSEIVSTAQLPLEWRALLAVALEVRERAHAPYSHFAVGAALRTASGRVFEGCNVENASFGLTICAERNALFKAVSEGETEFTALVVVTEPGGMPCGACRQVLNEFADDLPILIADTSGHGWFTSLNELLPHGFPGNDIADALAERDDQD